MIVLFNSGFCKIKWQTSIIIIRLEVLWNTLKIVIETKVFHNQNTPNN
jgi:hypothetical protein